MSSSLTHKIFKSLFPLSFWDIYQSGWPLFAILDIVGIITRNAGIVTKSLGELPPTLFHRNLWNATASLALEHLASSNITCDTSKAAAYFE